MDSIDKALLGYLQKDCKITNKALSKHLNLSVTAVYERIKKLERKGIIDKYVALLEPKMVHSGFTAFCQIKLVQHSEAYLNAFENAVAALDEVLECYHISGEYDYLLKVMVRDMDAFRNFMVTKLTAIKHIGSTQSSFSISEVKRTTVISPGE